MGKMSLVTRHNVTCRSSSAFHHSQRGGGAVTGKLLMDVINLTSMNHVDDELSSVVVVAFPPTPPLTTHAPSLTLALLKPASPPEIVADGNFAVFANPKPLILQPQTPDGHFTALARFHRGRWDWGAAAAGARARSCVRLRRPGRAVRACSVILLLRRQTDSRHQRTARRFSRIA